MCDDQRKNKEARCLLRLHKEAEAIIQVCERNGKIYACYDGVPLFDESEAIRTLPGILNAMRENYVEYFRTIKR